MKELTPSDIHPSLAYDDATAAIEWLEPVYGFTRRLIVPGPDGLILHSELSLGTGVIMISSTGKSDLPRKSPRALGGISIALSVYVADPDSHHDHAVRHGARILRPLRTEDYGARGYLTEDLEGHIWYFGNYRPGAFWT